MLILYMALPLWVLGQMGWSGNLSRREASVSVMDLLKKKREESRSSTSVLPRQETKRYQSRTEEINERSRYIDQSINETKIRRSVQVGSRFVVLSTSQWRESTYLMKVLRDMQRQAAPLRTMIAEPLPAIYRNRFPLYDTRTYEGLASLHYDELRQAVADTFKKLDCDWSAQTQTSPSSAFSKKVLDKRAVACGFKLSYGQIPGSRDGPTNTSRRLFEYLTGTKKVQVVHLVTKASHIRKVIASLRRSETKKDAESNPLTRIHVESSKFVRAVQHSILVDAAFAIQVRQAVFPPSRLRTVYFEDLDQSNNLSALVSFLSPPTRPNVLQRYVPRPPPSVLRGPGTTSLNARRNINDTKPRFLPCDRLIHNYKEEIEPALYELRQKILRKQKRLLDATARLYDLALSQSIVGPKQDAHAARDLSKFEGVSLDTSLLGPRTSTGADHHVFVPAPFADDSFIDKVLKALEDSMGDCEA